jgi:putative photosynthetic complex assembly protein 2
MAEHGLPALYAVFVWWFATGLILHLDGLRPETFRWSMAGATAVLAAASWGLAASAADPSAGGAYLAFTCALLVWGWVEMSFLTGWLTGPRKTPCEPGISGWPRFLAAAAAVLWHELAILAAAALVVSLTWGGPNQVGTWTFLILWTMRLSAKLNVFLGVRNLAESFLPAHLGYLRSFFRRRPLNGLFPFSVIGSTVACAMLFRTAFAPAADTFGAVGFSLLGTLMALAVLEHWFMVLPLPFEALWRWGLRSREAALAAAAIPARARPGGRRRDADQCTRRLFLPLFTTMDALRPRAASVQTTAPGRREAT